MSYLSNVPAPLRSLRNGGAMGCCGMGDDAAPQAARNPTVDLITQVNRFTRSGQLPAPIYRLDLVSGNPITDAFAKVMLQPTFRDVAITALLIHQLRLLASQAAIQDAGTAAQVRASAAATSDPVGYVMANLPMLTGSIAGFADQKGLAPPDYSVTGGSAAGDGGLSPTRVAVAGGVVLVLWGLSKKIRR